MAGNLVIESDNGHEIWSTGLATFVESEIAGRKIIVGVRCRISNAETEEIALLDTGSTYTVINSELVEEFENQLIEEGEDEILTYAGKVEGKLVRLDKTLLAEEGDNLPIPNALALISEEWYGPVVLGYRGLLDKIRIALDPGLTPTSPQLFYFGSCELSDVNHSPLRRALTK